MIAEANLLSLSATSAAFAAQRSGLLGVVLRPFATRPNVFVADDHVATKVTIHKTGTLDIEIVISTATRQWSATVRDVATGRALVHDGAAYSASDAATSVEQRTAMLGDLQAFLDAVVDAPVRLTQRDRTRLEIAAASGWRQAVPFAP